MIKVDNKIINATIETILKDIQQKTYHKYLKDIKVSGNSLMVNCPFHANGQEQHPSCGVISDPNSDEEGVYHCFACGAKGPITKLINACFEEQDESFGKQWLIDNYGNTFIDYIEVLPEIQIENKKIDNSIPEEGLNFYDYNNPAALNYLINVRHLKKEVIDYFKVGYNKQTNSVTFPCWNEHGKLVGVFERNISTKLFKIPQISPKPIYLINEAIDRHYSTVYVCESQINALTIYSWGYPAIALFGTGSKDQYDVLNKSGIRNFILCFDGDIAGDKGRIRFLQNIKNDCVVSWKVMPEGKDINDISYEEFLSLPLYM